MKVRRFAIALILASALGASGVHGAEEAPQQPGPPPLAALVRPLNLTAAQQEKLRPLIDAARARVREDMAEVRRNDERVDSVEFMARVRAREADLREKVQGVLTVAQLARYDELSEARTPQRSPAVTVHGHHEMDTPQTARER